jgi:Holliday junction resolvase RusA-like endonuclease
MTEEDDFKGDVVITLPVGPVRFKAPRQRKQALTALIKQQTAEKDFLLTGEVHVDIEWLIHEQDRYESQRSPDIDNILKPVLDTLQGPDGVLINDWQVQAISCRWIDWTSHEEQLEIRIRHMGNEWIEKEGLQFVRLTPTLCMPLNSTLPAQALLIILEVWEKQFRVREKLLELSKDYYAANRVMSVQRPFHISRIRGFPSIGLEEIRSQLRDPTDINPKP